MGETEMREGVSRRAASIIAAVLAVVLAVAVHLLALGNVDGSRRLGHAHRPHFHEAEASLAPESLSRP